MVGGFEKSDRRCNRRGFTLSELAIATTIFGIVSVGLYMGFISLTRSYAATTDFAINHADQMRLSDYLAMDLRRAVAVSAATNDTSITIPIYYDATGKIPLLPALDGNAGIFYTATDMTGKTISSSAGAPSAATGADGGFYIDQTAYTLYGPKTAGAWGGATQLGVNVRYYLQGDTIYRREGTAAATALATGVNDFNFRITDSSKVVTTQITFDPTFTSARASAATTLATSFYNTTLLRNSRRDRVSSLY